jgi:hypothetical protein
VLALILGSSRVSDTADIVVKRQAAVEKRGAASVQPTDEEQAPRARGCSGFGYGYGFVPGLVWITLTLLLLIWSFAQTLLLP